MLLVFTALFSAVATAAFVFEFSKRKNSSPKLIKHDSSSSLNPVDQTKVFAGSSSVHKIGFTSAGTVEAKAVGWRLTSLQGGSSIFINKEVIVGNNPSEVYHPGASTQQIDCPNGSVSASHALLGINGQGLTIVDLGSASGTQVAYPDGNIVNVGTSMPVALVESARLRIGSREFLVENIK